MRCLIAILAAGKGSRMGGGKLDRICAGKPLGQWAVDAAVEATSQSGAVAVTLFCPPEVPQFAKACAERKATQIVKVADAQQGLSVTVRAAFAMAEQRAVPLVLIAADMPLVRPCTIRDLAEHAEGGRNAATIYEDGQLGVPAAFAQPFPAGIDALNGDRGAGRLLRSLSQVEPLRVSTEELLDVDDEASLARVTARLARSEH